MNRSKTALDQRASSPAFLPRPQDASVPRYRWIREQLLKRIMEERLKRGDPLPPEGRIASQYGVSLGTVRKAIDELVALNVVVRHQGKGLFIATHRSARFMYDLVGDNDAHEIPPFGELLALETAAPEPAEKKWLDLASADRVVRMERAKTFSDGSRMLEYVALPQSLFPNFKRRLGSLRPTLIYEFYESEFGVGIMNFEERVRALPASDKAARVIGCAKGAPIIEVERVSFGFDRTPVEFRVSSCAGNQRYYLCSRR